MEKWEWTEKSILGLRGIIAKGFCLWDSSAPNRGLQHFLMSEEDMDGTRGISWVLSGEGQTWSFLSSPFYMLLEALTGCWEKDLSENHRMFSFTCFSALFSPKIKKENNEPWTHWTSALKKGPWEGVSVYLGYAEAIPVKHYWCNNWMNYRSSLCIILIWAIKEQKPVYFYDSRLSF